MRARPTHGCSLTPAWVWAGTYHSLSENQIFPPLSPKHVCVYQQIEVLRQQTFEVCDVACKANANSAGFPDTWLFHHRWARKGKGAKMPNGAAVLFIALLCFESC